MKTIILGDIHGKSIWRSILDQERDAGRIIFVGDYFDDQHVLVEDQIANFRAIIDFKVTHPDIETILLVGNHDFHYFPEVGDQHVSGYQDEDADLLEQIIQQNRQHLQVAYQWDSFLVSHAGVSRIYMDIQFGDQGWDVETVSTLLNSQFVQDPLSFRFEGVDPLGDNIYQGPLWIRPISLLKANDGTQLEHSYVQIFGHTRVPNIRAVADATGGRYQGIDNFNSTSEYLIVEGGEIRYGRLS